MLFNSKVMFKNFFTSTIRAFQRQKVYSTINITGLAVGISVSLMLFLFIKHEIGYDRFHEKGDRIFRVISRYTNNEGISSQNSITFGSVVPEIKKDIPEVEHATRIYNSRSMDIVYNESTYQRQKFYYTDHDFFDIFSFSSLYGAKPQKPEFDNKGAVISEELANTIFGDKVPIGQELQIDGEKFTILDVVTVPRKSHLQFDIILSLENIEDLYDWAYYSGMDFHSYGTYATATNHKEVNQKISDLYNAQMDDRFEDFLSSSDNYVQPLSDIYLHSEGIRGNLGEGSLKTIYVLAGINLLILLIAVINYINLTTAQYEKRIKEIGVRKVIGANRKQLIAQFLGESVMLTLMAFVGALALTQLLFEPFGRLMQIDAEIEYWSQPGLLLILLASSIVLGIFAGLYPALFISSFSPNKILKRDFLGVRRGSKGGKFLVAIQFLIAIVLVTNLTFLNRQIHFIKNKELGFDKEQILVVDNVSEKQQAAYETIASELADYANILDVTASQSALGRGSSGQMVHLKGADPKTSISTGELRTLHNFVDTYGIKLVKGRDFSKELVTDKDAFLINEACAKVLFPDGTEPLGQMIDMSGRVGPVIGVLQDFHYYSLKTSIYPLILSLDEPYRMQLSIKLNPANLQESLAYIESTLQKADPEYQLGYYFVDDYFQNMYKSDERNASLISYSSLLAAIISLVGLIALISHNLAKQKKEVAIRKVLGAELKQLFWVMTREFYWVVLIANLIAIPVSILIIRSWLPAFAYSIDIAAQWPVFIMIAVLSFATALLLITNQVLRRAKANPTEFLANE